LGLNGVTVVLPSAIAEQTPLTAAEDARRSMGPVFLARIQSAWMEVVRVVKEGGVMAAFLEIAVHRRDSAERTTCTAATDVKLDLELVETMLRIW
jgi:hypothetical protein